MEIITQPTSTMLTQSQENLIKKIKYLGQINIRKMCYNELMDANKLNDLGVIQFKITRRGNRSRSFLVIKEGGVA